jgi:hypothetical protein
MLSRREEASLREASWTTSRPGQLTFLFDCCDQRGHLFTGCTHMSGGARRLFGSAGVVGNRFPLWKGERRVMLFDIMLCT